jgi:hypothetical protein
MEIVDKAPTAAGAAEDPATVSKLEELKRHMDFVNAVFQAFVGGEADPRSLANVIRVKERLS